MANAETPTSTLEIYFPNRVVDGDRVVEFGEPTENRERLHEEIFNQYFGPLSRAKKDGLPPRAVLFLGGPASGKSTVRQSYPGVEEFIILDSDDVKAKLPEYQELVDNGERGAAAFVHEESSYLVHLLRDFAIDERYNVLIDGVGLSFRGYAALVETLLQRNYQVQIVMVDASHEIALTRARLRKRWVPMPILRNAYCCDRIRVNAQALLRQFEVDGLIFNSNVRPPELIWDRLDGTDRAHDIEYSQIFWEGHCPENFRVALEADVMVRN